MNDLTEFDHAVSAAFGESLGDPVQNAWLADTVYWTVWLGILCNKDVVVTDGWDEIEVDDETSACAPYWPYVPPTWQLIRSCEAHIALRDLGKELFTRQVAQATHFSDVPRYEEDFLHKLGNMPRLSWALCRVACN